MYPFRFRKGRYDCLNYKLFLGYNTTKVYYLKKLEPGLPFNSAYHEKKLTELENGSGPSYFEIILDIISEHPNIQLISN